MGHKLIMVNERTTLKEIRDTCMNHQKHARDCETCPVYRFCNNQMTIGYPSGWKLDSSVRSPIFLHMNDKKEIWVICDSCKKQIRNIDIDPSFFWSEEMDAKLVESPQDFYPNYCEHCGVKLK